MILYRFVDILRDFKYALVNEKMCPQFQGFFLICRKGKNLPTCPHTKNPQDVDNPVDNLGHILTN